MTHQVTILVLTAAVLHALWNFAGRQVRGNLVVFTSGLVLSSLLIMPIVVSDLMDRGFNDFLQFPAVACMVTTGILHGLYFLMLARAYEHGRISVVYPVARGSGIALTGFLAWIVLHEKITMNGVLGIALIVIGIFWIGIGIDARERNAHTVKTALLVGLTIALYSIVDKIGVGYVHPLPYMFAMWVIAALTLLPFLWAKTNAEEIRDALRHKKRFIIVVGPVCMVTYFLILYAYTMGPVSYIAAFREFAVVIGSLLGVIILKERMSFVKALAMVMIVLGMILIKIA